MQVFRDCMADLGVPLAEEKTEGPTEVLCFLGLELDSIHMVVRIPRDKIVELIEKIEMVLQREKVTLRQMQSLIGSLNFCCRAIVPGRPFCRRFIKKVQVGKDQEKAQSEKDSHSKNRGGKKPN